MVKNILVVISYFSRYFEIKFMKCITAVKTIEALEEIFLLHELPFTVSSDDGPQFVSSELKEYFNNNGIVHLKKTPRWPQANGEVERQNRSLLKRLKIAVAEGESLRKSIKYVFGNVQCYGPEEILKSPTLADISWRSSGGSSIAVTSSPMPPKPARTSRKQYSWQNPPKKDICMHIRIINPWEFRQEKEEMTFKSQGSINCPHKTNEEVASSNSHGTWKAVSAPAVLSVEGLSSLVARKRFLPTEYSALSLIDNFRKCWMAFKGFVSVLAIRLAIILGIGNGIMKISRCEGKRRIGTSMECISSERLRNVRISFPFSIFIECLITILIFQRKFFNYGRKYWVWGRDKIDMKGRRRLRSLISRPMLGLRNLRLGNPFPKTFMLRIGNILETFMARERFEIYLSPFSDRCASCHIQLGLFKLNREIRNRFKDIYEYIYLYIYIRCSDLVSYKLASYPGVFAIKLYNLVYFSPKVMLLVRKSYYKNQCIDLIGLAPVAKAYSRNRLFLRPNRPCWRELRPLVTPWVRSIKEGTDPWRNQIRALLSQCPGKLPSSLSLSLLLLLSYVLVFFAVAICL